MRGASGKDGATFWATRLLFSLAVLGLPRFSFSFSDAYPFCVHVPKSPGVSNVQRPENMFSLEPLVTAASSPRPAPTPPLAGALA